MTCPVVRETLGTYFDGELDPNSQLQLRLHLSECISCTAALDRLETRRKAIRSAHLRYEAPAGLEARIRQSIRSEQRNSLHWRAWGAVAAAVLIASVLSIRSVQRNRFEQRVDEQVVSSHVRAMITGHTIDVASTDRHTVKPWFDGRIDFAPAVNDLAADGYPLVGGRVDYINGRSVATLVYQRRKHVIDLFVWPATSGDASGDESLKGYNVVRWTNRGMAFAATSDLNKSELDQFRDLLTRN